MCENGSPILHLLNLTYHAGFTREVEFELVEKTSPLIVFQAEQLRVEIVGTKNGADANQARAIHLHPAIAELVRLG